MSNNPYESPPVVKEVVGINGGQRADLRTVAQYQKGIMYCILANIVLFVGNMVARGGGEGLSIVAYGFLAIYICVGLIQLALIVMLSTKVYNIGVGIIAGVLSFVPCVGLIILLIVNQKATSVLQSNGIKVGLMGADMSQL
ncbi:MAG TPA: hypothetical protein VL096_10300 [Pirellulaceae bacterium]|nr:hypothetical protein [Pirellulaceae bacterium]